MSKALVKSRKIAPLSLPFSEAVNPPFVYSVTSFPFKSLSEHLSSQRQKHNERSPSCMLHMVLTPQPGLGGVKQTTRRNEIKGRNMT